MAEKTYASWDYCLSLIQFMIRYCGRIRETGGFGLSAAEEMTVFERIYHRKWNTAIMVTIWTWFRDEREPLQSQQRADISHNLLIKPAPTSLIAHVCFGQCICLVLWASFCVHQTKFLTALSLLAEVLELMTSGVLIWYTQVFTECACCRDAQPWRNVRKSLNSPTRQGCLFLPAGRTDGATNLNAILGLKE